MQEEKGDDAEDWERLVERNRGGIISCAVCYRIGVLMYNEQDGMAGNERGFVMLLKLAMQWISKKDPTLTLTCTRVLASNTHPQASNDGASTSTRTSHGSGLIARPPSGSYRVYGDSSPSRIPGSGNICRSCHSGAVSRLQAIVIFHMATCAYLSGCTSSVYSRGEEVCESQWKWTVIHGLMFAGFCCQKNGQ